MKELVFKIKHEIKRIDAEEEFKRQEIINKVAKARKGDRQCLL